MSNKSFTNGEINRLGDKIRSTADSMDGATLDEMESYRTSYKESISTVFNEICRIKYKVSNDTIVTYRIKRFESIINKLVRFPKMKFSRMWDIGGCRCIVKTDAEAYKLKEQIESVLSIRKVTDYISSPKDNGYRSIHLYGSLIEGGKVVEIQIRNQRDHNWATLVEISDLLFESGLKEYERDEELLTFHKLLSNRKDLTYHEKKILANTIRKYKYIEKLSEVFNRNYLKVREQWLSIETKSKHKYFLIKASKNEIPTIEAFVNFQDAEKKYFDSYKENQAINIVLTHLPKPKYEKISTAYSNYILTKHSFEEDCTKLFQSLIIESLRKNKYIDFFRYLDYFLNIVFFNLSNALEEINYSKKISTDLPKSIRNRMARKEREWKLDIQKDLKDVLGRINRFSILFSQNMPKSYYKKIIIRRIAKFIIRKHRRKFEKININLKL